MCMHLWYVQFSFNSNALAMMNDDYYDFGYARDW